MVHPYPPLQSRRFFDSVLERLAREQLHPSLEGDWRIRRLRQFIDAEQGKLGWSLDRICEQLGLGVSGPQAAKLFKKHVGVGIREYTRRKRLVLAAEKLKTTALSVKEIAADLGYKKQTDLWRQFKQVFFLNPTEFRTAHHQGTGQNTRHLDSSGDAVRATTSNLKRRAAHG